jgi:hypothetical protein
VEIELAVEDPISNIIAAGFDLCLRTGWLKQSRLFAVRLGSFPLIVGSSANRIPASLCRHRGHHPLKAPISAA